MGILRPEALPIFQPKLSTRARAPELSFRARANADLLAASATRSPIVALVGLEGAGKSYTLQAFSLSHPRGVAKIRHFDCLRDPNVEFDLVDDFDSRRSSLMSASQNFIGTQILAMRPECLPSLRQDYPDAPVVSVQPMTMPDITIMIELLGRRLRLRRDVFTLKAKAALKNLCEANPKKLELLIAGAEGFAHAEQSPRISADHVERAARQWLLATHKVWQPKISVDHPAEEIIPATLKPKAMPQASEATVSTQAVTPPTPMQCPVPKSIDAILDTDAPELPEVVGLDVTPAIVSPTQESSPGVIRSVRGATAWEQLSAPMTMQDIALVHTARRRLERRKSIVALGCTTLVAGLAYAFGAGAFSSLEVAGTRWFVSVERTMTDSSVAQARLSLPGERPEPTSGSNFIKEAASLGQTPKVLPIVPANRMMTSSQIPGLKLPPSDIIPKPLPPAVALSMAIDPPPHLATPREVPLTLPPPPPMLDDRFGRALSPVLGGMSLASALPPLSILDLPKIDLITTDLIGYLNSRSPATAASTTHDARLAVPLEPPQKLQSAATLQPPAQASAMMSKTSRADDAERLLMLARSLFAIGQVDDAKGMLRAAADMGNADAIDAIRQAISVKPVRSNRIGGQSSSTVSGGRNQGTIDRRQ